MNASKPCIDINIFQYPRNQGGGVSNSLGGNIGYTDENCSWHLFGFPDGSSIG